MAVRKKRLKLRKRLITQLLIFGCDYLKLKTTPKIVWVNRFFGEPNTQGSYCAKSDTIVLTDAWPDLVVTNLFHELVHAKQAQEGWLKRKNGVFYWKKRKTIGAGYSVTDWLNYWNAPHERQARDIAERMRAIYLRRTTM